MKFKNLKFKIKNYYGGQATITAVIFFVVVSLILIAGSSSLALKESTIAKNIIASKESYFLSEAGVEDLSYRLIKGKHYDSTEVLGLDGFFATTTVSDTMDGQKEILSTASASNLIRRVRTRLTNDSGSAFHYGIQAGEGGFVIENSASISGNAYSNGPVNGKNSNLIQGSVVSAGPTGIINGIHATSSAYSHTISNSHIEGDAYYMNTAGTVIIDGTPHPNSPDQPLGNMPISDDKIAEWEVAASIATTSSPCPYIINSDTTLGPRVITCDLDIKGSPTITLLGPVWVQGNITIENTAVIRLDSSLGKKSIAIIADKPSNRLTSSEISLRNSVQFQDSGTAGSYILFISQNNSSENSGSEEAITIQNSANGEVLLYAPHGQIGLYNNINLREVTAYKIRLSNSSQVIYKIGMANLIFESGPGGGYSISDWEEVQ